MSRPSCEAKWDKDIYCNVTAECRVHLDYVHTDIQTILIDIWLRKRCNEDFILKKMV